jgi:SAM-dependent methyltransferase
MGSWLKRAAYRLPYLGAILADRARLCHEIKGLTSKALDREKLAFAYLRGDGIEIGALHNPLSVPTAAKVSYVDRLPVATLLEHYPDLAHLKVVEPDIVDDGERLSKVAGESQDFVIANHFLEHCQDPIGAMANFFRVLRVDGILYLALPDKRYTFDVDRPVTPLAHLIRDHEEGPAWSRYQHFEEYIRQVAKITGESAIKEHTESLMQQDYSIHFHVWTQAEVLEFLLALRRKFCYEIEVFFKNGQEMVSILRKVAPGTADGVTIPQTAQAA